MKRVSLFYTKEFGFSTRRTASKKDAMLELANRVQVVHRQRQHLRICGKYLADGGKLARISGLNIVNLTRIRSIFVPTAELIYSQESKV